MADLLAERFFQAVETLDVATVKAMLSDDPRLARTRRHGNSPLIVLFESKRPDDSRSWAQLVEMEHVLLTQGASFLNEVNGHQRLLINAHFRPAEQRKGWLLGNIVEECFKGVQEGAAITQQSQRLKHWLDALPSAQQTFGLTTVMTAWTGHIQSLQREGNFDVEAQQLSDQMLDVVLAFHPSQAVFRGVAEDSALHARVQAYTRAKETLASTTPTRSRRQMRS